MTYEDIGSLADVIDWLVRDAATRRIFAADRHAFAQKVPLSPRERQVVERLAPELLAAFTSSHDARIDGGVAVWHGAESPLAG